MRVERMPRTLLIGNGLNRTLDGSVSWAHLMEDLAGSRWTKEFGSMPAPIQYEIIAAERNRGIGRRGDDTYLKTKRAIANQVSKIQIGPDCIHNHLRQLNVENIITTNYDTCLEQAFSPDTFVQRRVIQTKYLLESTDEVDGVRFFHAHGLASKPQSICIGYEHYCGYIQHMRAKLLDSANTEEDSTSKLERLACGHIGAGSTWPELFFTTDVDIIGFGLDFSEIDIWWLLSLRAAFFSGSDVVSAREGNRIRFFELVEPGGLGVGARSGNLACAATSVKRCALEGLQVACHFIELDGRDSAAYRRGYNRLFDGLADGSFD